MPYSTQQVKHTSKLIVSALYKEITIKEAKSKMLPELRDTKVYKNFDYDLKRTRDRLNGETPFRSVPLNWAKEIYKNLRVEDKILYLEAIQRQIEEDKEKYDRPSHSLQRWVEQNLKVLHRSQNKPFKKVLMGKESTLTVYE